MTDPYREPTDDTSAPPATSFVPPTGTPSVPPTAATNDTVPAPAPSAAATESVAPVIPEGFMPPPSVGIPATGPGIPLNPSVAVTPETPTPAASVAPPASGTQLAAQPTILQPVTEAISVMPSAPTNDVPADTAPASQGSHLSGEIPLRDIPAVATQRPPVEPIVTPPPSAAAAMSAPVLPSETTEDKKPPSSAIRTLQSDIARTVHTNQLSIAQIALAQKEKNRRVSETEGGTERVKNISLGVGSVILMLAGLAILAGALYFVRDNIGVPFFDDDDQVLTIIPAKNVEVYDVSTTTRTALLERIDAFMKDPDAVPLDVRALVFTRQVAGTTTATEVIPIETFMELLAVRAPGRLVRTLGPDMMLGAVGNEPFLLTSHSSYDNAFAGMLEWEPLLHDDLSFLVYAPIEPVPDAILPAEPATTSPATTTPATPGGPVAPGLIPHEPLPPSDPSQETSTPVATTTPAAPVLSVTWKDIVVKNVDVRALIREDDELLMLYSFLRDDLLLITGHRETMAVILDILAAPSFGIE